eukprot:2747675-Pyramimonas_sp.AAC.1
MVLFGVAAQAACGGPAGPVAESAASLAACISTRTRSPRTSARKGAWTGKAKSWRSRRQACPGRSWPSVPGWR